jgi:hypothetical protein
MSLKILEFAVRTFCALAESEHTITPAVMWNWSKAHIALKATPPKHKGLVEEIEKLSEPERVKLLRTVGAFEPLTPLGEAFVFPTAKAAQDFAANARQAGGTVEYLDLTTVHVHEQDYELAEEGAVALGGVKVDLQLSNDYEHLDRQLPNDMVNAGLPMELVESTLLKSIQARAKLSECIVRGDGREVAFKGRLARFVTERTIGGVNARVVEALKMKGMIPAAALKVLGLAEAEAVGNVPPGDSASKGAPPDKGGVAKDQPDVRQGSAAQSKTEPQKEPKAPTEHRPTEEEGSPTGDVTLPDGHVVPAMDLAPSLGKLLQNIATQLEQGTLGGKPPEPKGDGDQPPAGDEEGAEEEATEEEKGEEAEAAAAAPGTQTAATAPAAQQNESRRVKAVVTVEHATQAIRAGCCVLEAALALETQTVLEVAPPGGEKVVKALKKQGSVDNPWAVAWAMKNKGQIEKKGETSRASMEGAPIESLLAEEDSHVLTIREEKAFTPSTFRKVSMPDGVHAIVGKLAEGGKLKVFSFIFPETKFTHESAKAWVTKQRSERVGKRRPELSEAKKEDEAGRADELAAAAAACEDAHVQVRALKAAAFQLATTDLVRVAAVGKALDLKKTARQAEKLRETVDELHEEIKKVLADYEELRSVFEKESGGAEVPEKPPAEAAPAAPAPMPVAVVAAPAAATPAPAPAEQAPAPVAESSIKAAVARCIKRPTIMEALREGARYAVVAESIRVACPDLNLTARQVLEVHDTLKNADTVARTLAIYEVALSEDDRKLVASVSKGPGDKPADLAERTAKGRSVKVVENDLRAVVEALRTFGDVEHRLLADDLEKPMKAARKQLVAASR